jgi:hypothetical protein
MATHKVKKHSAMAKQEVNSALIIVTGIISLLLLVVVAVGVEAWFRYEEQTEVADKWAATENTWLRDIRKSQLENLNPVTQSGKKPTSMPIDQAMTVVAQNQGKVR